MGNIYNELNNNGDVVEMEAPSRRQKSEYIDVLSKLDGFKKIHDHLIEVDINGKKETLAVFRIVAEGKDGEKDRKRVQISKGNVTELPTLGVLTIYVSGEAVVYGFSKSLEPLIDLPPTSPTTLTRTQINFLKKVFDGKNKSVEVISRKHNVLYKYSNNFYDLFDRSQTFLSTEDGFYFGSIEEETLDYQNDEILKEENLHPKLEIGRFAEEQFNELILKDDNLRGWLENQLNESISNIKWMNEFKESYKSYDFLIDDKIFIEIKGSEGEGSFLWSSNEKELSDSVKSNEYFLFKFNGVDLAKQMYSELIKYTKKQLEELEQKSMTILVKEK